jgi:hypothetical protein
LKNFCKPYIISEVRSRQKPRDKFIVQPETHDHGLAGLAISVTGYVIASRGKMADAMGFSVV